MYDLLVTDEYIIVIVICIFHFVHLLIWSDTKMDIDPEFYFLPEVHQMESINPHHNNKDK